VCAIVGSMDFNDVSYIVLTTHSDSVTSPTRNVGHSLTLLAHDITKTQY